MSITSTTNKVAYNGNGVTTSYSFPHPIRDDDYIVPIVRNETTGAETTLVDGTTCSVTIATDYTSATVDTSGGSAPYGTLTTSEQLIINRANPYTNNLDFRNHDGLLAEVLDEAIDRLTMSDQRLQEQIDRCLKLQISEDSTNPDITAETELPSLTGVDTAGKFIKITSDGDATPEYTLSLESTTMVNAVTNTGSSTDNAIPKFDGTTGKVIQNTGLICDDSNNLTGVTSIDIGGTIAVTGVLDEDNMASDSAVKLATQQSIKAYVDTSVSGLGTGDVVGPASSTDNAIARFDSTTGKLLQNTANATVSDGGELTLAQGITAGGGTFDASLSAWDLADSIQYVNNTDYARFIAYGDSGGTGSSAASAFVCIDGNKAGNERVLFFGMGGTSFTYHGGISAGNNAGTVRTLIGFDLDSAGADVIYMHEDLVCEAGVSVTAGDLTMTSGNIAIAQGAYMRFQGNTASREEIHSHVAGVLNISSRAGTHFYMDTDNNAADTSNQIIFYNNATQAAGTATQVAALTGGGAFTLTGSITSNTGQLRLTAPTVPSSASDTGAAGSFSWDSDYIYVCTSTNTWKRVAIATF